jgi:hypothetical protein
MTLQVLVENDHGMMEEVGHAVLEKNDAYQEELAELAEYLSKQHGGRYTQLWSGLNCLVSFGKPCSE